MTALHEVPAGAAWCASLHALSAAGVKTVCYIFMPVFDWIRTDFAKPLDDGSNATWRPPGRAHYGKENP